MTKDSVSAPTSIRPERTGDGDAIGRVTQAAFDGVAQSAQTEAAIVDALRAAEALTVSLVALQGDDLVGHVAFSAVRVSGLDVGWHGLGPVSVRPDRQGAGIGTALIERGLDAVRAAGARGCVVLGAPRYYGRFGFRSEPRLTFPGVPPLYFQSLGFVGPTPEGVVTYHPDFDAR